MNTAIFVTKEYVDNHSGDTPLYLTTFFGTVATEGGSAFIQGSAYSKDKLYGIGSKLLSTDADCVDFLKNFRNLIVGNTFLSCNISGNYYPTGAPSAQYLKVVLLTSTITGKVGLTYMPINTNTLPSRQVDYVYNGSTPSGNAHLEIFTKQIN